MKNTPVEEGSQKPKTRQVILIQDRRSQMEIEPVITPQVQSNEERHAFGLNLIKGNQ